MTGLRPFFPYYGGKYRSAPRYPAPDPVRERIASQVERISHWIVKAGPYTTAPNLRATWFVDPPYHGTRHYPCNASAIDFPALAEWCRSRRGQVMVCEADGATWLPFRHLAHVRAKRGTAAEAIWTNA